MANTSGHFLWVPLSSPTGKVSPSSTEALAMRKYLADRQSRHSKEDPPNRVRLVSDPSIARITHGWNNSTPSSPGSSPGSRHSDTSSSSPVLGSPDLSEANQGNLLVRYKRDILPLVHKFSREWKWCTNLQQICASPMLMYATLAYTSAFPTSRSGVKQQDLLTSMSLQTKAVSKLRTAARVNDESINTAIMLLRLALLLGDAKTGTLHLDGLKSMKVDIDMKMEFKFADLAPKMIMSEGDRHGRH